MKFQLINDRGMMETENLYLANTTAITSGRESMDAKTNEQKNGE